MGSASEARLVLLDDRCDLDAIPRPQEAAQGLVCLFWAAPGTRRRLEELFGTRCGTLRDVIEDGMSWGKAAYELVLQVTGAGPLHRGLPCRAYLAEPLWDEAVRICLLRALRRHVMEFKRARGAAGVVVDAAMEDDGARALAELLARDARVRPWPLPRTGPLPGRAGRLGRLFGRARECLVAGGWAGQCADLLEGLDKTARLRTLRGRLGPGPRAARGNITFFSSYRNNSRTLAPYLKEFPGPAHWVLANRSALDGMPRGQAWSWLWESAPPAPPSPRADETPSEPEEAARWLAASPAWRTWLGSEGRLVQNLTACWDSYIETVSPRLVVTANQSGIEGWFTMVARSHGVPVVQIAHGLLGGYFHTRTPVLSDALVVSGDFWAGHRPPQERPKLVVHDPVGVRAVSRISPKARRRRLTFISHPLVTRPYFHNASDLNFAFIPVFKAVAGATGCEVAVRAHPLENPAEFAGRWARQHGPLPPWLVIVKGEPLEATLASTDVALMFRSTVMLDCLANGIPVVMPKWIDFGFEADSLGSVPGVFLAEDYSDLEAALKGWVLDPPTVARDAAVRFNRGLGGGNPDDWRALLARFGL